jgi:hypothetical protein
MNRWLVAILLFALPMAAQGTVTLTFTVEEGTSPLNFFRATGTCSGSPTCTGVFTITERETGCNNGFSFDGTFTMTGVDLSHPGTFSGTIALSVDSGDPVNVNGVCTYSLHPGPVNTYTATWDGVNGVITTFVPGEDPFTGRFTATGVTAPPVFPMNVTTNINATTANVGAQIQPKPADAGTTQSVFVFAYAPQSLLAGKILKDGPDPCVLAQVSSNGQLTSATASTLTPTTTTVLTSQGTAITILGNTPTPNVAGATMYVGYGPNSTTMFGTGTYQGAVNIPGATQCTSNLASSAVAAPTGALTGLWWKSDESGWGIHFTQRGTNVFAAWYTYDSLGKPKWYVSTCAAGTSGTTGTCSGILYEVNGPTFFGGSFNPSLVNAVNAGNLQLNFSNPSSVAMTYTVGAQTRSLNLTRQPLATGTAPPAIDFSDI